MNRDAVFAKIPAAHALRGLTNAEKKEAVESAIDAFLLELEQAHADPDAWEATELGAALNAVLMGWYTLAVNYVALGLAPPEERAQAWPRQEHTPDTKSLRVALDYVRGTPVRS